MGICGAKGISVTKKWCKHQRKAVIENDTCKVLWDFMIQTVDVITARTPELVIFYKGRREYQIIDFMTKKLKRKELSMTRKLRRLINILICLGN